MKTKSLSLQNIRTAQPELSGLTDGALVNSALDGRDDCFAELVRRYQRPIAAYVYRLTGDYEAALDLTQDVFIKVYSSLARYRPEFKFSTWIYKIAHNAAIDHLRRITVRGHNVSSQVGGEDDEYELPLKSHKLSPEQESEQAERRAQIEIAINELTPAYRELLTLRHAQDLSYDEIVDITGLPLGTVKNRLFRAREALRDVLLRCGISGF